MKRTQIQLDERTYELLRQRAFKEGRSVSSVVRELLIRSLGGTKTRRRRTLKDFGFVGVGRTDQGALSPVSERHDEALKQAILGKVRP